MKKSQKTRIISILMVICLMFGYIGLSADPIKVDATTSGQSAFEGPFTYYGTTTTTYRYFSSKASDNSNDSTRGKKTIDESKTVTITEEQPLTYWLHTPINYDSSKSYPIWVFCSGSGCTIFEHENYATKREVRNTDADFLASPYSQYYRQSVYYGEQFWICGYKDINGNWVESSATPGGYDGLNTAILEQWYNLVYVQNKTEYDCFILYVQPEDESWWENHSNLEALCIHTMAQSKELCEKYDADIVTYSTGQYRSGYVIDEISANPFSQLTAQFIDKLMEKYNIDSARQYLSGHSLGAQFSFDTMCHYPDRFACAVFSGLPASDITETNAERLIDMNVWAFVGNTDGNCAPAFSSDFINVLKKAIQDNNGTGTAKYTACSGGHSGTYLSGNSTYVSGDTYTKGSTDIIDFLFNSRRSGSDELSNSNDKISAESATVSAKVSPTLKDDTYDMVLISGTPLGDFDEHGFVITTGEEKEHNYDKTKTVAVKGMVKSANVLLGDSNLTLKATDYNSAFIYVYVISGIPKEVTSFDVKSYAEATSGIYYGEAAHINVTINGENVSAEVE